MVSENPHPTMTMIAEGLSQAYDITDIAAGDNPDLRVSFHFGIIEGVQMAARTHETPDRLSEIVSETLDVVLDGGEKTANEVKLLGALAGVLAMLRGLQGEEDE